MPIIEIDGVGRVEVGDEFLKMDPAAQDAFVGSITQSAKGGAKSSEDAPPPPGSGKPVESGGFGATALDVAKSGGVGLVKGGAGVAGMLGDGPRFISWLADAAAQAPARAYNYATKGTFDLPASMQQARQEADAGSIGPEKYLPGGSDIVHGIEQVAGPLYQPQTTAGKYAQTAGEFVPAAVLAPGSIVGNAVRYGVLPGLASEGAGQLSAGTPLEPYARTAAAIGTAGASALLSAPAYAERLAGRAVNGVTEQQFAQAQQLMRDAEARGIRLTADEAIQHVTGGATRAGDLRRVVESTTEGGQRFAPVMAARPGQMQAAVDTELNRISPIASRPYDIAPQVQDVGVQAMQSAERMRSNATRPYYEAAKRESVNPNAVRSIVNDIDQRIAGDATGIIGGPLSDTRSLLVERAGRPAVPATRTPVTDASGRVIRYENTPARAAVPEQLVTDIENLDRARKFIRDQNELPPFAAQAIPKEAGAAQGNVAAALRDRMERASDNFRQGRLEHERITRNVIEPLTNSPTGQLATAATSEAQRGILFPANPLPGSQQGIGNAIGSIANRNPELARQVVRQEAEMQANSTVRGLDSAGRPDQFGGAKYARAMRDNPQFATNFDEALRRAGGDVASHSRLVDVLQATGHRQRPGSLTAFNQEALGDMKRGGIESLVQALSKPLQTAKDAVARRRLGSQAEKLAEALLAGPQGVDRLRGIANQGSGGRDALVRALLAAEGATNASR